ncbi:MAG: TraR/DksA family transcriptional regulator [Desulfatibacillaceae bacterium]
MNKEEKEQLRERILATMESLKQDIEAYGRASTPVEPDDSIGRLTRMDAINSRSMNEAALRKARGNLSRLEQALKNLDDPDFGLCAVCDEPIPIKRLLIMPEAEVCVRCMEKAGEG